MSTEELRKSLFAEKKNGYARITPEQKEEMKRIVIKTVRSYDVKAMGDKSELRGAIRRAFKNYVFKRTKGSPMVLPVITEL